MKPDDIFHQLRQARMRQALSQYDLADLMGTHQSNICHLERGDRPLVALATVERWANALGYELRLQNRAAGKWHAPADDDR